MVQLIASFILLTSTLGIGIIIFRKVPVLVSLPKRKKGKQIPLTLRLKKKSLSFLSEKYSSYDIFLQKLLSRIRILCLRTDCQTSTWLEALRKKSKENKIKGKDNYWQEVKKSTKGK